MGKTPQDDKLRSGRWYILGRGQRFRDGQEAVDLFADMGKPGCSEHAEVVACKLRLVDAEHIAALHNGTIQ